MEYKVLKANSVADLTTAMNAEVLNGYSVVGSVTCSMSLDASSSRLELFTVLMARKTA